MKSIKTKFSFNYLMNTTLLFSLSSIISIILFLTFHGCATSSKDRSYPENNYFESMSEPAYKSSLDIDKDKTYEVYFRLNQNEECLKFNLQTITYADTILKKGKILKTYFVVEKAIDIYRFKSRKNGNTVYTEIGKNYDYRWNRKREITICTSKNDPLKKLTEGIYRIRFSNFQDYGFKFKITIFSNNKIEFIKK